jgi:hypothetical protein
MQTNRTPAAAVLGIFLALGIMGGAWLFADAIAGFKAADRYVTVKGLAEREVDADLAIWPLSYNVAGDDLLAVQRELAENAAAIRAFLLARGFEEGELGVAPPRITDLQAQYSGGNPPRFRYSANGAVTVHTPKVREVLAAMSESGELVSSGVVLVQDWERRPQFFYTGLNAIKPEMIADATTNAREAAAQFARDSGSEVGNIRRAVQGLFSISDRDANTPQVKKIRVVTTVDYFLRD